MLNNYDSLNEIVDGVPVRIPGRTTVFIPYASIKDDGTFETIEIGDTHKDKQGFTFIVDVFVPEQFEKLKIDNSGFIPKLVLIDGESIDDPRTTDQILLEEKELELIQLKSKLKTQPLP